MFISKFLHFVRENLTARFRLEKLLSGNPLTLEKHLEI